MTTVCPECGKGQGAEIPGSPGDHYSDIIMVEIQGVYDGGLFYMCPFCDHLWHRWSPEDKRLYAAADFHMKLWREWRAQASEH